MANPSEIPYVHLDTLEISEEVLKLVPKDLAYKHGLLPIDKLGRALSVVMVDPTNEPAIDELKRHTGLKVMPCVSDQSEVWAALREHYGERPQEEPQAPEPASAPLPPEPDQPEPPKPEPPPAAPTAKAPAEPPRPEPPADEPAPVPAPAPEPVEEEAWPEGALIQDYTFSTFVLGRCNQDAHVIAKAVARTSGSAPALAYLLGASGFGKSHILHAIGAETKASNPSARICYKTAQELVDEMLEAIQNKKLDALKRFYVRRDLVLLDDLHYLVGKKKAQQDLAKVLEAICQAEKRLVITSERPFRDMESLADKLKDRFSLAPTAELQAPDAATRQGILISLASRYGIEVPADVAKMIAERIETNARDLESCLKNLGVFVSIEKKPVTKELAEMVLAKLTKPAKKGPAKPAEKPTPAKAQEKAAPAKPAEKPTEKPQAPAKGAKPAASSKEKMLKARQDFAKVLKTSLQGVKNQDELRGLVLGILSGAPPLFQAKGDLDFLAVLEEAIDLAQNGEVEEALRITAKACKG